MDPKKFTKRDELNESHEPSAPSSVEPSTDDVVDKEGDVRVGRDWDAPRARDIDDEGAFEQPRERPDPTADPDLIDETENRE